MEPASPVTQVRARIAHCWAIAHADVDPGNALVGRAGAASIRGAQLGAFTLRPAQLDAVQRALASFTERGGALLADPPGTGKTIVALAVAARYESTIVIAPAALRNQWAASAARAGVPIRFLSMETLSRSIPAAAMQNRLVVVDEAHHARNRATRRYAHLATLCDGAHVLLLSATPVVNRARDRDALLGLFLGARAESLSEAEVAGCVIRRTEAPMGKPAIRRLPLAALIHGGRVAQALEQLPPPFPAVDGAPALALVRITLAMAWASSLAALDAALRRRVQRGMALLDSLRAGRWPTRAALRQWIVSDECTQLAFPDLEPIDDAAPARAAAMLSEHLAAVRRLRALIGSDIPSDTNARADALRALMHAHPGTRIVVFARSADTIRALWSALRGDRAVVALVGERVLAAAGRWRRDEVLRAVGPRAREFREDDPRGVRLLLTTDLFAEGVDLQGVGILVHADRAWTPARHEQREGRIARLGGRRTRREVLVTRFASPPESLPLLRLGERLRRKQSARGAAMRSAELNAEAEAIIRSWTRAELGRAGCAVIVVPQTTTQQESGNERTGESRPEAFLAAIAVGGRTELVTGRYELGSTGRASWRISASPNWLARVARRMDTGQSERAEGATTGQSPESATPAPATLREIRRALARFTADRTASQLIAAADESTARLTRRLHHRAGSELSESTLVARTGTASSLSSSLAHLSTSRGAGLERRLTELLSRASGAGLETLSTDLQRLTRGDQPSAHAASHGKERPTLLALLILAAAPRATSPP